MINNNNAPSLHPSLAQRQPIRAYLLSRASGMLDQGAAIAHWAGAHALFVVCWKLKLKAHAQLEDLDTQPSAANEEAKAA